jgi:hypothetical protein
VFAIAALLLWLRIVRQIANDQQTVAHGRISNATGW